MSAKREPSCCQNFLRIERAAHAFAGEAPALPVLTRALPPTTNSNRRSAAKSDRGINPGSRQLPNTLTQHEWYCPWPDCIQSTSSRDQLAAQLAPVNRARQMRVALGRSTYERIRPPRPEKTDT